MTTQQMDTVGAVHGGRMSRQRKRDAVLRLLRGEDLDMISRSLGVTAATLSGWRNAFLDGGEALATKAPNGEERESDRLKARLGEMLLESIGSGGHGSLLLLQSLTTQRTTSRLVSPPLPQATGMPAFALGRSEAPQTATLLGRSRPRPSNQAFCTFLLLSRGAVSFSKTVATRPCEWKINRLRRSLFRARRDTAVTL